MGGQNQVMVTKDHQVQIFRVYFWATMHRKRISVIIGDKNSMKVTKSHQVQIFKCIFELLYYMHRKGILGIIGGQPQAEVTKAT